MSSHVLIVDAVPTHRIYMRAELSSAHYEVCMAGSAQEALDHMRKQTPEVILVGDCGGMGQSHLINRLRLDPRLSQTPILAVTAPNDQPSRMAALDAGADEVLSKPLTTPVLLAHMRALQRARAVAAELAMRESTQRELGLAEAARGFAPAAKIAVLQSAHLPRDPLIAEVAERCGHDVSWMAPQALMAGRFDDANGGAPDAFIVVLDGARDKAVGLQIMPELRARAATRHASVIVVLRGGLDDTTATLIDLGANDLVRMDQVSVAEMLWRVERQVTQSQQASRLRNTTQNGLKAAATDELTGLFNRRYALPHLARLIEAARKTHRPLAVMMADLDHFKAINDRHGHAAGDAILKALGARLRDQMRSVDMVARLGGEEFLIVMPDTSRPRAFAAAERLCRSIGRTGFVITDNPHPVSVTISIGVTMCAESNFGAFGAGAPASEAQRLIEDADRALYEAKAHGRNTVELFNAAAA